MAARLSKSLREIPRESINPAPYNPRAIPLDAKVKLKSGLEEYGLVEPLIWNEQTGNLVGGHQRLAVMDAKFGSTGYLLPVSVVSLSLTREKQLNILLNNPNAQGWYDWQKMADLLVDTPDIDIVSAGFDLSGLRGALESFADLSGLDLTHVFGSDDDDPAAEDAEQIAAMKADKGEYKEVQGNAESDGFYLTVVFPVAAEKERFCRAVGVSGNARHAEGRALSVALGIDIGWTPPPDPSHNTPPAADSQDLAGAAEEAKF